MADVSIAIDGNEANIANRVGSNVYAFEIISALEKLTQNKKHIAVTVLLNSAPTADMPKARSGWAYQIITPKPFWTQLALPLHLFKNSSSYDVFYAPGHYAPRHSKVPYVSSVMDLAFLHFPEQFKKKDVAQLTQWTAYSVKEAKKVIAISRATRQDVIIEYKRRPSDVVVAYPAVTPVTPLSPAHAKSVVKKVGVSKPYILYIGTLQPRKNLVRLIAAFEELLTNLKKVKKMPAGVTVDSLQLIIAGKTGWLADSIMKAVEHSPYKDQILLTGYISDEEKKALYQEALCSVLVGLYEGFGIPPLESMQYGTVPVVANTTSLPEVVGPAGIIVDPRNSADIAEGLQKAVLLTAKQRAEYRKKGRQQVKKFSWMESAEKVLKTLLEVAGR